MNPLQPYYFTIGMFLVFVVMAHELSFVYNNGTGKKFAVTKCLMLLAALFAFGFDDIDKKHHRLERKLSEVKQEVGSVVAEELKKLNEEIAGLRIKSETVEMRATSLTNALGKCEKQVTEKDETIIRLKDEEDNK